MTQSAANPFPTTTQLPVIVKFTASYCGPCRQLTPMLASLAAEYAGRVEVIEIDIEAEPDIAQRYRVRAVPTLLGLREGNVVAQQVGTSSRARVESMFAALVA